jgi:hypothetical protein
MAHNGGVTLTVNEGRVYGARYYTVAPVFEFGSGHGWYNQYWNDMLKWCFDTFGPTPEDGVWTPSARWYANSAKFWFRNEADLTLFVLRWQ